MPRFLDYAIVSELKAKFMSQDRIIKMKSTGSKTVIRTFKNKKQNPEPLVLRKYDKVARKHVTYKETKK